MTLPAHLEGLLHAEGYPHAVEQVELVETHISWVFLAGDYAYKVKRPVRFPFLDFREPARREFLCREELRLNQRFAPELYLDVCAITVHGGRARIDGDGSPLEYAVRMRRFDRTEELDRLARERRVGEDELFAFGARLARIHDSLPVPEAGSPWSHPGRAHDAILKNLDECAEQVCATPAQPLYAETAERVAARLDAVQALLRRRAADRIRECHGDLHAQNVLRLHGQLVAFDCLEFEPAFRWIDVADEIAFLFADLVARGSPDLAFAFLAGWLEESGDYEACTVLDLYAAHRALIRSKVENIEARTGPQGRAAHRLACRDRYVATARLRLEARRPALVLVGGPSGSGKTWLARRLAPQWCAVHVRSDVERKRLAGLKPLDHSGSASGQGLYSPDRTRATYERLEAVAAVALRAGFNVLVDATFLGRAARDRFVRLAAKEGAPSGILWCTAPESVLRTRVIERGQRGDDASEAGIAVLEAQLARMTAPADDEGLRRLDVDTTAAAAPDSAQRWLAELATVRSAG